MDWNAYRDFIVFVSLALCILWHVRYCHDRFLRLEKPRRRDPKVFYLQQGDKYVTSPDFEYSGLRCDGKGRCHTTTSLGQGVFVVSDVPDCTIVPEEERCMLDGTARDIDVVKAKAAKMRVQAQEGRRDVKERA